MKYIDMPLEEVAEIRTLLSQYTTAYRIQVSGRDVVTAHLPGLVHEPDFAQAVSKPWLSWTTRDGFVLILDKQDHTVCVYAQTVEGNIHASMWWVASVEDLGDLFAEVPDFG